MKSSFSYYFFLLSGTLSLSVGIIGVFVPVLPTTPFLLLSSYCYCKSSKRLHYWITHHPVFGTYIQNYIENKGIRKKDRTIALVFLWAMLILSMVLSQIIHLRYFLMLVGVAVTIHLMKLKVMD
jgi:uncharacterized membrane protein YbaN (DUF454 family)